MLVQHSSASVEWYTPPHIIELAREVMGAIDCDPASSPEAQKVVKAAVWYDLERNGLDPGWRWGSRVWLNPPYGRGSAKAWITELVKRIYSGEVIEAIALLSAQTGDKWFHDFVFERADAIAWPRRIHFWGPDGKTRGQPGGSALVYYGPCRGKFVMVMWSHGIPVTRLGLFRQEEPLWI